MKKDWVMITEFILTIVIMADIIIRLFAEGGVYIYCKLLDVCIERMEYNWFDCFLFYSSFHDYVLPDGNWPVYYFNIFKISFNRVGRNRWFIWISIYNGLLCCSMCKNYATHKIVNFYIVLDHIKHHRWDK